MSDCYDDDHDDDHNGDHKIVLPTQTAAITAGGALTLDVLTSGLGSGAEVVSFKSSAGADLYVDQNGDLLYLADSDKLLKLTGSRTTVDTITYRVEDDHGHVATGTINVTVGALPSSAFVGTRKSDVYIDQNNVNDLVFMGKAADGVLANGGNDTVYGGSGSDQLFGGDGNDLIVGGSGGDYLYGEYGDDTLVGGAGADTFAFTDFWNDDVIVGFDPKHDTIQLPTVYFSSFAEVKAAAHDDGHGNVVISTPDHTGAVSTITLADTSVNALKASEFIFI